MKKVILKTYGKTDRSSHTFLVDCSNIEHAISLLKEKETSQEHEVREAKFTYKFSKIIA